MYVGRNIWAFLGRQAFKRLYAECCGPINIRWWSFQDRSNSISGHTRVFVHFLNNSWDICGGDFGRTFTSRKVLQLAIIFHRLDNGLNRGFWQLIINWTKGNEYTRKMNVAVSGKMKSLRNGAVLQSVYFNVAYNIYTWFHLFRTLKYCYFKFKLIVSYHTNIFCPNRSFSINSL